MPSYQCVGRRSRKKPLRDRKSTRLNSSHSQISYAVFCLKKKKDRDDLSHMYAVGSDRLLKHAKCIIPSSARLYLLPRPDITAAAAENPPTCFPRRSVCQ